MKTNIRVFYELKFFKLYYTTASITIYFFDVKLEIFDATAQKSLIGIEIFDIPT